MLWALLLAPLVVVLLREAPRGPKPEAREASAVLRGGGALVARGLAGFAWYLAVHDALHKLGDAAASAIYKDRAGAIVGLVYALPSLVVAVVVAWAWSRRAPRRWDGLMPLAVIAACTARSISSTLVGGPAAAEFGRVLALPPSGSFVENVPNRPVVRHDLNEHGFRGPSFTDAKPADTLRGVLVGDSFVFGSGVELPDTLSESLRHLLAERAPRRSWEILNLGIAGDNLPSHIAVYEEAVARLDPDFVVLCLTLPNDLSAYDDQVTRRSERELGAYMFARWAVGSWFATWMWSAGRVATTFTPEGARVLEEQTARLARDRSKGTPPPLLVFTYRVPEGPIRTTLERIPGTMWIVPPVEKRSYFIPLDGHPTGAGNRAFAASIADAMTEVPALSKALARE